MFGLLLYSQSHATLHSALDQVTRLTDQRRQVHLAFRDVEKDIRMLQHQLVKLDQGGEEGDNFGDSIMMQTGNPAGKESVVDEMIAMQEKLRDGNSRIDSLQRHLQETSRKDAIAKYGAGTIRVELLLDFPDSADGPNTLIMEMAPLDLMPHSVYMFLEMVHAGLFNGCSFILNAMHVIKAAPLPYDGSSASAKVKAFTKRGLESVAFREYSADYPHFQYTIGFAADGSPSFYINSQDNSDIHVGDPCFAKIVAGIDTVHRLEAAPTRNGIWYRQRIGLKRATIL
jgi:cyclophilin family peptidyl-prolyl cis-trans isomerase